MVSKEKTIGDWSLGKTFGYGFSKVITERAMKGVVGNGTVMSGALKLGSAALVGYLSKPYKQFNISTLGEYAASGMGIDGVEDIMLSLMGNGGSNGESQFI